VFFSEHSVDFIQDRLVACVSYKQFGSWFCAHGQIFQYSSLVEVIFWIVTSACERSSLMTSRQIHSRLTLLWSLQTIVTTFLQAPDVSGAIPHSNNGTEAAYDWPTIDL